MYDLKVGQRVTARYTIAERDEDGQNEEVYAETGDSGTIVFIDEEGMPTVEFDGSGTTICGTDELQPVFMN